MSPHTPEADILLTPDAAAPRSFAIPVAPLTGFYGAPPAGGFGATGEGDPSHSGSSCGGLEIRDVLANRIISGRNSPVEKVVGQQITLEVEGDIPDDATIQWTIPENDHREQPGVIRDYTLKSPSAWYPQADYTPLKGEALEGRRVTFYWTNGVTGTVSVEVKSGDETCRASAEFEVIRPVPRQFAVNALPKSGIGVKFDADGNPILAYGKVGADPTRKGIEFNARVAAPRDFGGTFGLVQRITVKQGYELDFSLPTDPGPCLQLDKHSLPGGYVLDRLTDPPKRRIPFYNDQVVPVAGGGEGLIGGSDSPDYPFREKMLRGYVDHWFELYLVYLPDPKHTGEKNVFVTLRKLKWGWGASLDKTAGGKWPSAPTSARVRSVEQGNSIQLPRWTARIQDLDVRENYRRTACP